MKITNPNNALLEKEQIRKHYHIHFHWLDPSNIGKEFDDPCHGFGTSFFWRGADFICEVSIARKSGGYHSNHELHLQKTTIMTTESQPLKDVSAIKTC